jgi:hypothetical protein
MAGNLHLRVSQHFIRQDSSIVAATAVRLDLDYIQRDSCTQEAPRGAFLVAYVRPMSEMTSSEAAGFSSPQHASMRVSDRPVAAKP